MRTKRLPAQIAEKLADREGWNDQTAAVAALALMHTAGFVPAKESEERSNMITFCPENTADRLAQTADLHASMLLAIIDTAADNLDDKTDRLAAAAAVGRVFNSPTKTTEKKPSNAEKTIRKHLDKNPDWAAAAKALTAEVAAALNEVNPMIALMGRMYASMPEGNVDGAVQAAHAITTHAAVTDGDYFTTVDDLNPADETGAGFLDVADYASGVFYKYATVDLDALSENLGGALTGSEQAELVAAFADRFARTMSDAKKRVTAPHTPPSLVLVVARADRPVSYANAFERPIMSDGGYIAPSVNRLLSEDAEVSDQVANDGNAATTGWLYISRTATDDMPVESAHALVGLGDMAALIAAHLGNARVS